MKKYTEMGYSEFMREIRDYINSLEAGVDDGDGEKLSVAEWRNWIEKETQMRDEALEEDQINWIIQELVDDGYVVDKPWYALQMDLEDNDWGTGSYDIEEAKAMLREYHKDGYVDAHIAIIDEGIYDTTCEGVINIDDI